MQVDHDSTGETMLTVATWNVNSVRIRLPRLLSWLERRKPTVACLQEIKVIDEDFPAGPINELGYQCIIHGQKTYNGVAILSLLPAVDVARSFPGNPAAAESRVLSATIGGVRIMNIYAVNGQEVGSDKYALKLDWYRCLRTHLESLDRGNDVLLCGDLNVAPEDRDVWDPEQWRGKILCSDAERASLRAFVDWGLADVLRMHHQEGGLYTWWDYRAGAFHRGWGMRIDHILASAPLARRCIAVEIDRDERKGEKPSDHAPVVATFE
jgi:exodeoxyribonuclease-3